MIFAEYIARDPAVKAAYLGNALTETVRPPVVGRTHGLMKNGNILLLRVMPAIPAAWDRLTDRLRVTGTQPAVEERPAAGGWSQQRFARRRDNQADELVTAVADHAARILIDLASPAEETSEIPVGGAPVGPGLIVGGDRQLVAQVLADRRLAALRELPRRTLYDLADPNRAVLETAIKRGTSVRILLSQTVAH